MREMPPRILLLLWLAFLCLVWTASCSPATKIGRRSNDLPDEEDEKDVLKPYDGVKDAKFLGNPHGKYTISKREVAEEDVEEGNDQMLGDQPQNDDGGFKQIVVPTFEEVANRKVLNQDGTISGLTEQDILDREDDARRNIVNGNNNESRSKEMYISMYKHNLLAGISKPNGSVPFLANLSIPFAVLAAFKSSDSPYVEKIRSFYPTCDMPKVAKEAWKEENLLNLFFNVDYKHNATIATSTLRLYRLPRDNQTNINLTDQLCPEGLDEEKLLRVSVYWYFRSTKKHNKVKRRLSDSKMTGENSPWVEISVKAATKSWTKHGKNMGLAVQVEDQDGVTLRASKYFKGASCTVGTINTPTPRPIPTFLTDTARHINDSSGLRALLGFNETGSLPDDFGLLPKIDVCVLELPGQLPLSQSADGCELKNTINGLNLNMLAKQQQQHLHQHHIRHQKHLENEHQQHHNVKKPTIDGYDFRSSVMNKTILMPRADLEKFNNRSINR